MKELNQWRRKSLHKILIFPGKTQQRQKGKLITF